MSNNKGFSLIEVLVGSSIILMLLGTFVPLASLLEHERMVLSERRIFTTKLHDELQEYLWGDLAPPTSYLKVINEKSVTFDFIMEAEFIKGCVKWENVRKGDETICLYGY